MTLGPCQALETRRSGIASVTLITFWTGRRYLSVCLSYEPVAVGPDVRRDAILSSCPDTCVVVIDVPVSVLTDVNLRYEACCFIHSVVILTLDTRILPPISGTWRDSYEFSIF